MSETDPFGTDFCLIPAVLLVGGLGTRLWPYTATFPKPLVPLGDRPILEILLRRLLAFGITRMTLATGHLGELVEAYFSRCPDLLAQIDLRYVHEDQPLGTAGALSLVPNLDTTFLVMNGDVLTDLDFSQLVRFHRERGAHLTIAAHRRRVPLDLGVLQLDLDDTVTGYLEKPVHTFDVSMGIYVFEPAVLEYTEPGVHMDFPELVLRLLDHGERVVAHRADCRWFDIGRPDDYAAAQAVFAADPSSFS